MIQSNTVINNNIKLGSNFSALSGSITISAGNTNTYPVTITTHGNPVFCMFTGDFNCVENGAWARAILKRGTTELCRQIGQGGGGTSINIPFGIIYLDIVEAGTYTYNFCVNTGSGNVCLTESNKVIQDKPTLLCMEVPGEYNFYKFPAGTVVNSSTTPNYTLSIKSNGRPIFICCSGDNNPSGASNWHSGIFYKDNVELCRFRDDTVASSYNNPFTMIYLDTDTVRGTTYNYKVSFPIGSGTCNLTEEGYLQSPNFCIFEI